MPAEELDPAAQERLEREQLTVLRREVRRLAWERDWPEGWLGPEPIGPGRERWSSWLSAAGREKLERAEALLREQAC